MIGGMVMARRTYALVGLPGDLGRRIFDQMRNVKQVPDEELERRAREIELNIMRKEANAKKHQAVID